MGLNEETVKNTIIVPFLQRKGIDLADLSFETRFKVRVGREEQEVGGACVAEGRLDILVRRGDRNLLVVETKREDLPLTENDRDQGISYARLLHPIAPFVLLANGTVSELYDTISKELIAESVFNPCLDGAALRLSDDDRDEALALFFSLAPETLRSFSQGQVRSGMAHLLGSKALRTKKYIPELHAVDSDLESALERFVSTSLSGFALIGESGAGKTSALCHFAARRVAAGMPTLFFSGMLLDGPLLAAIADEFAWEFAEEDSSVRLSRRLARLRLPSPLLVIIDGVDDWQYSTRTQDLIVALKHCDPATMRIVFSCKAGAWPSFTSIRGTPTGIDRLIATDKTGLDYSHYLSGFSDRDFGVAIEKYRIFFRVHGMFEEQALQEAQRSPFLLRILFEVAAASNSENISFNSVEVFQRYLHQIVSQSAKPESAEETLRKSAKLMAELDSEWVVLSRLRSALRLPASEEVDRSLFERNVFTRRKIGPVSEVGFSFEQLRSYLIAFAACCWHTLSAEEFRIVAAQVENRGVGAEALSFYYRYASEPHKRVIDQELYDVARNYLEDYRGVLADHFPYLKSKFRGCNGQEVGFVGEITAKRELYYYGFRPLRGSEEEVLFVPGEGRGATLPAAFLHGVESLHWSGPLPTNKAQSRAQVVDREVMNQIGDLIKDGSLNEAATPKLQLELLTAMIWRAASLANPPCIPTVFGRFWDHRSRRIAWPVSLIAIRDALRRTEYQYEFHLDHMSDASRSSLDGTTTRYERPLDYERRLSERIDLAMQRNEPLSGRTRHVDLEKLKRWLCPLLDSLGAQGVVWIDPTIEQTVSLWRRADFVSREELLDTIAALWRDYLDAYRRMVELNFPTTGSHFELFAQLPLRVFLAVDTFQGFRGKPEFGVRYAYCKGDDECEVITAETLTADRENVFVDGMRVDGVRSFGSRTLSFALRGGSHNPAGIQFLHAPLRELVYAGIERDFNAARGEVRESLISEIL